MTATAIALGIGSMQSCDSVIYDDLDPCPQGVALRFVFDYNMEFANAFPSQVDCLTLLIYDAAGNYVKTVTETTSVLADEDWRMVIDLPAGQTYSFVAYGGMECASSSFHFVDAPGTGSKLTSLEVTMNSNCIGANPGVDLHPLFYGSLDLEVPAKSTDYTVGTVNMMKDTNTLRILLQNVDNTPVDPADFRFEITADNTLFGYDNAVIPTATTTYSPWAVGQVGSGIDPATGNETLLAFAEFSTSRFIAGSADRLIITNITTNKTVLSIPLVNYLLLYKSLRYDKMGAQEFLDRESRWDMILFLDSYNGQTNWNSAYIVVNDWIVRINNATLE